MESNDIVKFSPALVIRDVDDLGRVGKMLAISGYFEDARDAAQASVKVLAGMEMGFGPFTSMTGIHIIKGKPSVGANLMAAAVKANPRYDYRVRKMDDKEVALEFFELVSGKWESLGTSSFTAADAQRAGTQNMGKFPRNMLFARAISNGIKWFCPDVFNGNTTYTPDELGAEVDENGDVITIEAPVRIDKPDENMTVIVDKPTENGAVISDKPTKKSADSDDFSSKNSQVKADKPVESTAVNNDKPVKKQFDEEEFLKNFSQPAAVTKMSYLNAKGMGSDKTGQLYDEMTTKDLYCHWLGLSKKLNNSDLNQDQKDSISLKISAICAILWKRKQDRMIENPTLNQYEG